jgi:hypothetical protein
VKQTGIGSISTAVEVDTSEAPVLFRLTCAAHCLTPEEQAGLRGRLIERGLLNPEGSAGFRR